MKISVDIGGSGQGGPRLTNGSADFAFIAREMMGREESRPSSTSLATSRWRSLSPGAAWR